MKKYIPHLSFTILVLFLTFSTSVFSVEDRDKTIDDLKKKIEKTKKNYEEGQKKLRTIEKNKKNVLDKLKEEEIAIEKLSNTITGIQKEEKMLEIEIERTKNNLSAAELQLASHSDEYKKRLRSMYKRQKVNAVETLISSGSISGMLRGLKMLTVLAKADLDILNNIRKEKSAVQSNLTNYQRVLSAKYALGKQKKSEQLSLETTKKKREQLLKEIKKDESLWQQRLVQYKNDIVNAQNAIEEARRKIDKTVSTIKVSEALKNYNFGNKKGRLPWPVKGTIKSPFGTVVDPKTKTKTTNRGIEIETKIGDPVKTIGAGLVVMRQFIRGYGNFIMIYHPPKYYTIYAHLSDILVNKDQEVKEGEIIGMAGSSGLIDNTQSVLLLEILNGKNPENPLSWLIP